MVHLTLLYPVLTTRCYLQGSQSWRNITLVALKSNRPSLILTFLALPQPRMKSQRRYMNDILSNPWVVGIGITIIGTVVAGLILYFVFGIGKSNDKQKKEEGSPQIEPKKQLDNL